MWSWSPICAESRLVSSANLTSSGIDKNIEAGILVRGGTGAVRVAEHFTELTATGILIRL